MIRRSLLPAILALVILVGFPVRASDEKTAFVEANILSIFYHELGHAVIDLMDVPIFGQEEDAADVMAVLLIDWLYEEETAQAIAYDSAFGFINDPDQTEGIPYWDIHGPDEQRFYNHVCLFFGANPDDREELAADLGLPDERAETCPEEYDQATASWGMIFDEMDEAETGVPMAFTAGTGADTKALNGLLAAEIADLNVDLKLPRELLVRVESCGEANAFYDPEETAIIFCTEFIPHLRELFDMQTGG